MRSGILSLTASLMMAGPTFGAKKFWGEVPYQEWNREQVSKILTKSPWAHQFHISRSKLGNSHRASASVPVDEQLERSRANAPGSVGILKQRRWVAVHLLFPRDLVQKVNLRDQKISRKFKLKDMVLDGKLVL